MTPRDIVLQQIRHEETDPLPYTLAFEEDVSDRLDAHYGSDAWRQRIVPYITACGSPAVIPQETVDDTHHRDAFGSLWRTDELPSAVVEPGLKSPDFAGYAFPSVDAFLDESAADRARESVQACSSSFSTVSTGICLWQSWYVRGFEETLADCAADEGFYAELLDRFTDLTLGLVDACAGIPADGIMMGDDWGCQQGVMIGPERWRRLVKPRYARIFDAIHAQGKIAVMHCCGSVADIMGDIVDIGLDVLESVQPEAAGMDPYGLKKAWGDGITFWGGLGSQYTIPFDTPEAIRQEIRRLRAEMGKGGGYILAPAKPVRRETPTENAVAVVEEFLAA